MTFQMRAPCKKCGGSAGKIITRNGQDCVYCAVCENTHCYNAPKTETGRKPRTVSTVHEAIKPKQRARILLRDGGRCVICGKRENLHVGHIIPVKVGLARGMTENQLNSDENLCAMCDECNLGMGQEVMPLWMYTAIVLERLKRGNTDAES